MKIIYNITNTLFYSYTIIYNTDLVRQAYAIIKMLLKMPQGFHPDLIQEICGAYNGPD